MIKQLLYKIGRRLMHLNYVKGSNAVEHDLRLEVSQYRKKLDAAKLEIVLLKMKNK